MIQKNSLQKQKIRKKSTRRFNIDIETLLWVPKGLASFWKDLDGRYLGCNDLPAENLGYNSRHDITLLTDFDLPILRKEAEAIRSGDLDVLKTHKPCQFDYTITTNEKIIHLKTFKAPLYDEGGNLVGVYGIDNIVTITQLKSVLHLVADKILSKEEITKNALCLSLTNRQLDCLYYLVQGMTLKDIGRSLNLSPRTIEHYLDNIKNKWNCYSRADLIRKALNLPYIKEKLSLSNQ